MMQMRRKDRELTEVEAREILVKGEYGILATVDENAQPYAVPVSYAVEGDNIYIHGTNVEGQKAHNIGVNNKVCFSVVGPTKVLPEQFSTIYYSVICIGTAAIEPDRAKKKHALELFIDKYSPEFREKGLKYIDEAVDRVNIYAFHIDTITGKAKKKE